MSISSTNPIVILQIAIDEAYQGLDDKMTSSLQDLFDMAAESELGGRAGDILLMALDSELPKISENTRIILADQIDELKIEIKEKLTKIENSEKEIEQLSLDIERYEIANKIEKIKDSQAESIILSLRSLEREIEQINSRIEKRKQSLISVLKI